MAVNNIKIFDQNKANMLTDEAYSSNVQRINGVQQGIASSQLQNKTLYQVSLVAYAIGQMMQANGLDANDADAVSTFANNMSQTIMQKVLDKANSDEAIAGTNNTKFITPSTLKAAVGSYTGKNLKNNDFRNYTTVLEAANAAAPGGTFFATNAPDPLYNAPDTPFGAHEEFQYLVLCDADNARKTVLAFNFNRTKSMYWYFRRIFQGKWNENEWIISTACMTAGGIVANDNFGQRRFTMSPQTPIAYCPWGWRIGQGTSSDICYMLPNQEANLIMTSSSSVSNLRFVIFNISTGVEYITNIANSELEKTRTVVAAYDSTSICLVDGLNAKVACYRFSSSSAFTLASIQVYSSSRNEVENCLQNAFDDSTHLFGAYAMIDSDYNVGTFDFNKSNNNLHLITTFPAHYSVCGQLVRVSNTVSAVLSRNGRRTWDEGVAVTFIGSTGNVGASKIVYPGSGLSDNDRIVGALLDRVLVSGGSVPFIIDQDGNYDVTNISGTAFNLPDKTCLIDNAHYSHWDGPDGYPGVVSKLGNSVNSNWEVNGTGSECWMYEGYNARISGKEDSSDDSRRFIKARASAVPYSFFIL